jgi:hypothetical protein
MIIKLVARARQHLTIIAWTAISLLAIPAVSSLPLTHDLCAGIVEENDLNIPVGAKFAGATGGIDEATFHKVLDKIEKLYAPIVKSKGGNLKLNRKWDDGTVNAYAQQFGTSWQVNMFGGLARHPAITDDGFALVACHELGHHLGGAPKINNLFSLWATNEGGADYFATLKCLRLYFDDASNAIWFQANEKSIPSSAIDSCSAHKSNENETLTCIRGAMAGMSVARLFQDLRQETTDPAFETPDPNVVSETDDAHPGTQCRLDTYLNGALCDKAVNDALSDTNYKAGSCAQANGYTFGYRSLCWFHP